MQLQVSQNFPLNEKYCKNSIVYKASLKTNKMDKFYYGSVKQDINFTIIIIPQIF